MRCCRANERILLVKDSSTLVPKCGCNKRAKMKWKRAANRHPLRSTRWQRRWPGPGPGQGPGQERGGRGRGAVAVWLASDQAAGLLLVTLRPAFGRAKMLSSGNGLKSCVIRKRGLKYQRYLRPACRGADGCRSLAAALGEASMRERHAPNGPLWAPEVCKSFVFARKKRKNGCLEAFDCL